MTSDEKNNNRILLAIDFEKQSVIALEYAVYFARLTGAGITILHVIERESFISRMFTSDEQERLIIDEAEKLLNDLTEKLREEFEVDTIIDRGKAYEKIVEVATTLSPRFILMGKSEEPGFKKRIVGSNTLHVIQESRYPVITIRGSEYIIDENKVRDIVLPLDLTKNVREQVAVAIVFAKYLKSKIRVLSMVTSDLISLELQLLRRLNHVKKEIEQTGIVCTATLRKDTQTPVHDAVIEFAKEGDCHLIIIMTQEEGNIIENFIGSNAKGFIEKSDIPVLTVNPWQYESDDSLMNFFIDPLGLYNKAKKIIPTKI